MNRRLKLAPSLRLTQASIVLTLLVISLGAYTRLKDAGLGCPDWPGCYGQWIVPQTLPALPALGTTVVEDGTAFEHLPVSYGPQEANKANTEKAWIEMIHRYAAGLLGLCILGIACLSVRARSLALKPTVPLLLVGLVVFQALLGMWTVTLRLYPVVVMAHLLGGMATVSGLWWWWLRLKGARGRGAASAAGWVKLGLVCLVAQIVLGGWTSANYAALVCLDFPFCQGFSNPPFQWLEAFNVLQAGNPGSPGSPLSFLARATVHMVHRFWAVVTVAVLVFACHRLWRAGFHKKGLIMGTLGLLGLQLCLGVTNVVAYLPLYAAVLHNTVAVLLLLTWLTVLREC